MLKLNHKYLVKQIVCPFCELTLVFFLGIECDCFDDLTIWKIEKKNLFGDIKTFEEFQWVLPILHFASSTGRYAIHEFTGMRNECRNISFHLAFAFLISVSCALQFVNHRYKAINEFRSRMMRYADDK